MIIMGELAAGGVHSVAVDSAGNLQAALADLAVQIAGEDLVNDHLIVHPPANTGWAYHVPAENTTATITLAAAAAGTGTKHVVTSIQASISAGNGTPTAAEPAVLTLTDGASVKWTRKVAVPATAGGSSEVNITGLWIPGTAETAMTLAFAAGAGIDTHECVSFTYVDIV